MDLKTIAIATALSVVMAGAASAATYGFTFDRVNGPLGPHWGSLSVTGLVTLGDGDGRFNATSVVVTSAPFSLGFEFFHGRPDHTEYGYPGFNPETGVRTFVGGSGFLVRDGAIVETEFWANNSSGSIALGGNGRPWTYLTPFDPAYQHWGQLQPAEHAATGVIDLFSSTLVFSRIDPIVTDPIADDTASLSAVPLPAGLPLLLAGLGSFGFMPRRRKAS